MPTPNKDKLACELARQNAAAKKRNVPTEELWGPNGTTNTTTMRKQIVRVLKNKKRYGHLAIYGTLPKHHFKTYVSGTFHN